MSDKTWVKNPCPPMMSLELPGACWEIGDTNRNMVVAFVMSEQSAALIAAAPEMLNALCEAETELNLKSEYFNVESRLHVITAVRAAIAKAKGV